LANAQRGWNAQPDGGASGEGNSPLTATRLERWRGSVDGLLAWSARV
jgi:hypothetical protein